MTDPALTSVRINNFRGLRKLELVGLGQVNVLLGGNNSGKTSVLEAISIICNAFDPTEWLSLIRRRDFGRLDESRIQSLKWCLNQEGRPQDPTYLFTGSCEMACLGRYTIPFLRVSMHEMIGEPPETHRSSLRRPRIKAETASLSSQQRCIEITHELEGIPLEITPRIDLFQPGPDGTFTESIQIWEDEPFIRPRFRNRKRLQIETLCPYSYQFNDIQVRRLSESIIHRDLAELVRLMRDFDHDIQDMVILSQHGARPSIYVFSPRFGPAPLSTYGDALRRVVLIATTLDQVKNGVLLIDEVEAGYHVSALSKVFTWLAKAAETWNVQVIVTTHSLEAVDAMIEGAAKARSELVAYHLDQDEGQTLAKRFDDNLLTRLRKERGLDLR